MSEPTVNLTADEWHGPERLSAGLSALPVSNARTLGRAEVHFAKTFERAISDIRRRLSEEGTPCPKQPMRPGNPIWAD